MKEKTIGVFLALDLEGVEIINRLENREKQIVGKRVFYTGMLCNKKVVVAIAFMGKVSSAITTTLLIEKFKVDEIYLLGTAGALGHGINIGDIIIADKLIQHDIDARPLCDKFVLPPNKAFLECSKEINERIKKIIDSEIKDKGIFNLISKEILDEFCITSPKICIGTIASGDKFISDGETKDALIRDVPHLLSVDMEASVVGMTCDNFNIPFCIIKTVSDSADSNEAKKTFEEYTKSIGAKLLYDILSAILKA